MQCMKTSGQNQFAAYKPANSLNNSKAAKTESSEKIEKGFDCYDVYSKGEETTSESEEVGNSSVNTQSYESETSESVECSSSYSTESYDSETSESISCSESSESGEVSNSSDSATLSLSKNEKNLNCYDVHPGGEETTSNEGELGPGNSLILANQIDIHTQRTSNKFNSSGGNTVAPMNNNARVNLAPSQPVITTSSVNKESKFDSFMAEIAGGLKEITNGFKDIFTIKDNSVDTAEKQHDRL